MSLDRFEQNLRDTSGGLESQLAVALGLADAGHFNTLERVLRGHGADAGARKAAAIGLALARQLQTVQDVLLEKAIIDPQIVARW